MTWARFQEILKATPLPDDSWSEELKADRAAFDAEPDVYEREKIRRRQRAEQAQQ